MERILPITNFTLRNAKTSLKKYGISTGSVSAVAEEFEEEIPDIHMIWTMMIKVNATRNSPKYFFMPSGYIT